MRARRPGAGERVRLYVSTTATCDGDLDLIAVEKALNGEPVSLTPAEKIHAARLLDDRGLATKNIAQRIGCDSSTVNGWRDNGWKPGPHPKTRPRAAPRPEPVCGDPRMYRRHVKNGESCAVCRAANAAADRRYRLTGSRTAG